jgi:hypothetical protein
VIDSELAATKDNVNVMALNLMANLLKGGKLKRARKVPPCGARRKSSIFLPTLGASLLPNGQRASPSSPFVTHAVTLAAQNASVRGA